MKGETKICVAIGHLNIVKIYLFVFFEYTIALRKPIKYMNYLWQAET